MTWALQITEADHVANEFHTLGGAGFRTKRKRDASLATVPEFAHDCDNDTRCYLLDVLDQEGDVVSEREITEATALTLLGVNDLAPLRERAIREVDELLSTVRTNGGQS